MKETVKPKTKTVEPVKNDLIKIKMRSTYCGATELLNCGEVYEVSKTLADTLISNDMAIKL